MPEARGSQALATIVERLKAAYPGARYELEWETPLQLLVATILAAQCTDERVNAVTRTLFPKYPDARSYAEAAPEELEEDVRPTGFYRNKAKAIRGACRVLVERFGGEVPRTMEGMLQLPGVARKTANVVLTNAFGILSGIIVDTHVARVSRRIGLTDQEDPDRIEDDLMRLLPQEEWIRFGPAMVLHGRYVCTARAPKCGRCTLDDACEKRGVAVAEVAAKVARPTAARAAAKAHLSLSPGDSEGINGDETRPAPGQPSILSPPIPAGSSPDDHVPPADGALPEDWRGMLAEEFDKPYFRELQEFLAEERRSHQVFPPEPDVFNAFRLAPFERTRVVLLGQDPYHDDGQAHGLCFSVRPGVKTPPSLKNMLKELRDDLGCRIPAHGCLEAWARQGILMLNAVLTVRVHEANSHKDRGWEAFTDAVIRALDARDEPVVFVLWGNYAQKKGRLIDARRHCVVTAAHPSPLSARKFFGSRPFSAINEALERLGKRPIEWELPEI